MKITAMTLAVIAGVAAKAGEPGHPEERKVAVCMESDTIDVATAFRAKEVASKMFSGIGVTLDWRGSCQAEGILINLSDRSQAEQLPHALAYSLPYEGTQVVIFYDRVRKAVDPPLVPSLLAHVLVHEITHILQGIQRHSREGVMKATWNGSDYSAMTWKPLAFTPEDIDLIRRGWLRRGCINTCDEARDRHEDENANPIRISSRVVGWNPLGSTLK
jgi:hypothetical protein